MNTKTRTTRRDVLLEERVLCAPYCSIHYALRLAAPNGPYAYTAGVYGWNADVYELHTGHWTYMHIVTGPRPFGRTVDYDLLRELDDMCEQLCGECRWTTNPHEHEYHVFALDALSVIYCAGTDPNRIPYARAKIRRDFEALPRASRTA